MREKIEAAMGKFDLSSLEGLILNKWVFTVASSTQWPFPIPLIPDRIRIK